MTRLKEIRELEVYRNSISGAKKGVAKMKEHPILFSTLMVQALPHKSQTRRTRGLERNNEEPDRWKFVKKWADTNLYIFEHNNGSFLRIKCPYGVKGDGLWVREAFYTDNYRQSNGLRILYKADGDVSSWAPSIFMPRWASRITLEITGIRVERLQEITENDIVNEGLREDFDGKTFYPYGYQFIKLWDSINGKKYPWSSNPWVWVIEFKRLNNV